MTEIIKLLNSCPVFSDHLNNEAISCRVNIPNSINVLNWIINQNFISGPPHPEFGSYTCNDVQAVINELFDERIRTCRQYDKKRVNYIFAEALKHQDYEPGCGEDAVVILLPVDSKGNRNGVHPVLIPYTVPCLCGD